KMVHAVKIANKFMEQLPAKEAPEYTEGYEGFYHLISFEGTVEKAEAYYIIRDFDRENFEVRKEKVESIVHSLQQQYSSEAISLDMIDQYYNMREKIEPFIEIVENSQESMQ